MIFLEEKALKKVLHPLEYLYHFLFNSKILTVIIIQIILFVLLIDLPRISKKAFVVVATIIMFYLWINIILLVSKILSGSKIHIHIKNILLMLSVLTLAYSLMYYALYNYDKNSFSGSLDKIYNKENDDQTGITGSFIRFFDMIYFTITTMFTGSFGDIIPRTRIVRLVVISQFIISVIIVSILLVKAN
jgi:hypothetical protein